MSRRTRFTSGSALVSSVSVAPSAPPAGDRPSAAHGLLVGGSLYHQPGDTIDKLNVSYLRSMIQLIAAATALLGDVPRQDEIPSVAANIRGIEGGGAVECSWA